MTMRTGEVATVPFLARQPAGRDTEVHSQPRLTADAADMRHLGYVKNGEGKMPNGSIANTAMTWKPRKN